MTAYDSWAAMLRPSVEYLDEASRGDDWDDYRAARADVSSAVVWLLTGAVEGATDENLAMATRALVRTAEAALNGATERWAEAHPARTNAGGAS